MSIKLESAILGGGCFWCIEAIFVDCKGVEKVLSGYAGGLTENPKYEEVCEGSTGHAEVIKVDFNPTVISFEQVLKIFFAVHDPTTLNRQGHDVGSQYRSVVFYTDEGQLATAQKVITELKAEQIFDKPIVTEVKPLDKFYKAEGYHQQYYQFNQDKPYCQVVINPKIVKFRQQFKEWLKK